MKKVLATVLLIFALMSTEATMALRSAATSNRPAARPQQGSQPNVPVWLQGAYSQTGNTRTGNGGSNPTTPSVAPVPVRETRALRDPAYGGTYNPANTQAQSPAVPPRVPVPTVAPAPTPTAPRTGDRPSNIPVWLRNLFNRDPAYGGTYNPSNIQAQGQPVQPRDGNIYNNNAPGTTQFGTPNMGVNTFIGGGGEAVRSPQARGRTMFGAGVGPGTLDPSLWNLSAQGNGGGGYGGGFGSRYGGNWGGGGGGGGWDYGGGGSNDYPAWVKTLMGLNSWNIK